MCGIFGYFDLHKKSLSDDLLLDMAARINHRGPDGYGCYHNSDEGVALGNQRLAILDVEHGQQPFYSDDKEIVVVQNGEIFNHIELAEELASDGFACDTACDTEVILRIFERDGITGISKLNGMFSIAIYDGRKDELFLVRDRVGEKPLFFTMQEQRVLFASEIKSILPAVDNPQVNAQALNQFLAFNFVPPPLTMFDGVEHVMPGEWLRITRQGVERQRWWDLASIKEQELTESEWIEGFNNILDDAVKIRLRSDVPFGAFLSGGVDSSSVVGIMSQHLEQKVNTFCIGFDDPKYDESSFAQAAADRFDTSHLMQRVEPNLLNLWPMATYHSDQPHGDVSFLPTYKVAELAAQKVKMVLTGDGADELFAGYDKYKSFFNGKQDGLTQNEFQKKYLENITLFTDEQREQIFTEAWKHNVGCLNVYSVVRPLFEQTQRMDRLNQALYLDMMLLLPGNNLVKPDRMGMAVSIENRAPFLDFRMMEFAFSMPGSLKLKNGETKYLYKKAVTPLIGQDLAYRKKQMFTVPVGEWFKDELYDFCCEMLLSDRTVSRGVFNAKYVSRLLEQHVESVENNTREIRALIAVELWFREFMDPK